MKPSHMSEFLKASIKGRHPVLITGAPGVGKSDIVDGAARASEADVIISHPAVSDPTDAKGLPWVAKDGESATFLPFGELAQAVRAKRPTVWFLDDLGQAPASVQASFMQLLLARRVNNHVLPECVTFIAATNRRTDRAGVSGILEPVKSRFMSIVDLDPDLDDWVKWAIGHDIPGEFIAFLRFRPDLLCNFTPSADLTNCPVPRTWANAARVFNMGLSPVLQSEGIAGAVGKGACAEFSSFLALYQELPNIEQILKDPEATKLPTKPAILYAVVTALGMKCTEKNFKNISVYAHRLMKAQKGEFSALLLKDCTLRCEAVSDTKAFEELATTELGSLIAGE